MASNLAKLSYELAKAKGATLDFTGLTKAVSDGVIGVADANMKAAKMHAESREKVDTTGLSEEAVATINPLLQDFKDEYFQASKDARNIFLSREKRQAAADKMNEINFRVKAIGDSKDIIEGLQDQARELVDNPSAVNNMTQAAMASDLISGEFWKDVKYENGVAMYAPEGVEPQRVDKIKLGPQASFEISDGISDLKLEIQEYVEKNGSYTGAFKEAMENKLAGLLENKDAAMAFAYDGFRFQGEDMKFINHYLDMQEAKYGELSPSDRESVKETYKTSDLRTPMVDFYKQTLGAVAKDAEEVYEEQQATKDRRTLNIYRSKKEIDRSAAKERVTRIGPNELAERITRGDVVPSQDIPGFNYIYSESAGKYMLTNKQGKAVNDAVLKDLGFEEAPISLTRDELAGSLEGVDDIYQGLIREDKVTELMKLSNLSREEAERMLDYTPTLRRNTGLPKMGESLNSTKRNNQ